MTEQELRDKLISIAPSAVYANESQIQAIVDLTKAYAGAQVEASVARQQPIFEAAMNAKNTEIAELKADNARWCKDFYKIKFELETANAEIKRLRDGIQKGFEKLAEIPYCSVLRTIFDNANGVQNGLESLLSPAPVTEGKEIKTYKCNKCGVVVKADGKPLVCVRHVTFRTSGVCGGAFNEITLNEDYHE